MSDTVIRDIGEIDPPPPAPIAVRIVETTPSRVELRAGDRIIGVANAFGVAPSWAVGFTIPGVPPLPAFIVTKKSEAIDALTQFGYVYVAAKAGELQ